MAFKPFDYGQAIQQGQQNALGAMKMREGIREVQGRNMLAEASQMGAGGANWLKQQGRPDQAAALQAQQAQQREYATNLIKDRGGFVDSEDTYNLLSDELINQGLAQTREEVRQNLGTTAEDFKSGWTRQFGKTTKETNTPKWMRISELARSIEEKTASESDVSEFEALTKPSVSVNVGQPTKNVTRIVDNVFPTLEVNGASIADDVENQPAYTAALSTEAQTIMAKAEKAGNPISLEKAARQAHDQFVKEGKLKPSVGISIFGWTPGKDLKYDPNGTPDATPDGIKDPKDLKEGEEGEFNGYKYKRIDGKLKRMKTK